MSLEFLKNRPARLLFFIFIANFFYDDPSLYLYKRILYVIFICWATWDLVRMYQLAKTPGEQYVALPAFYKYYIPLLLLLVIGMLIRDFQNPNLKLMTLFQNPYALLMIAPIFIFFAGENADNDQLLFDMMIMVSVIFLGLFSLPFAGKLKFYQGFIASLVVLPMFVLSLQLKRAMPYVIFLIIASFYFSSISDYRIVTLRILAFFSLFFSLHAIRKFGLAKGIVIGVACFLLWQFITNLENFLSFFKSIVGAKQFDDDDTRDFLWEELFNDLNGIEILVGRGFLGTYFSPYFLDRLIRDGLYEDHFDRYLVEVGFLQLILKGGVLYYILYIYPLVKECFGAIFTGFRDPFVFNIGIYILTELMLMFIENIPYYGFQFGLMFFMAGIAYRKTKLNVAEESTDLAVQEINLSIAA